MLKKRIIGHMFFILGIAGVCLLLPSTAWADSPPSPTLRHIGGIDQAGGTIRGMVKFDGKQIARKPIKTKSDKFCAASHGQDHPLLNERWVFGDQGSLQNVFIWVSKGLKGKTFPMPTQPAVLDQVGCVYAPRVMGVAVGQPLNIVNSDETMHNINSKPRRNRGFNEGMPFKGMVLTKKFTKPEKAIAFKCDIHGWMSSYVHVVDSPFFAVSGKDGSFEIRGLPKGEYELSVWHEFKRFRPDRPTIKVTVGDGPVEPVTITYGPKKKKKKK